MSNSREDTTRKMQIAGAAHQLKLSGFKSTAFLDAIEFHFCLPDNFRMVFSNLLEQRRKLDCVVFEIGKGIKTGQRDVAGGEYKSGAAWFFLTIAGEVERYDVDEMLMPG